MNSRFAHAEQAGAEKPHQEDDVTTAFLFDTITDNSTGNSEGGGNIQLGGDEIPDGSIISLAQTIVAGGIDECQQVSDDQLRSRLRGRGHNHLLGYNLIDDTTCGTPGTGDIIGQSPQLGALGDNGGPVLVLLESGDHQPGGWRRAIGGVHRKRGDRDGPAR